MKHVLSILFILMWGWAMPTYSQSVNLTPWPKEMSQQSGQLVLPQHFRIQTEELTSELMSEVERFAEELSRTTGIEVSFDDTNPTMRIHKATSTMDEEGYNLTIAESGITVETGTAAGLFYALQSIKKMLPANVAAGVLRADTEYTLPLVTIKDAPRFRYRGFMLDVSRHFFTTDEVKKILRLMALYKMNHFHWHLTDDQGWRVEIKKYPKLTSVGAVRDNSWNTDMNYGSYWANKLYGPYFYTQDEIRDVVEYAARLHITVVPEVEMPGHLAAAMTAYPKFSCTPNGSHSVWISGGISTDVLNVGNDAAVQFAKDILSELAPLFPGEVFHVGGDETPTTAWQNNAECRAVYQAEGMTNYSQLQSRFTKQIAEHLQTLGKRIAVWNEAVTASGANTTLIKESGATVYCWNPCQSGAQKAANLGLNAIITNYGQDGCYYINRKANNADYGAGNGGDNLQKMYAYLPVPSNVASNLQKYYYGVQGTFWCEHVSDTAHLEHLALPRLMGIAETGWTPQARKNFTQFVNRMKQDTAFLNMAGYHYHPQYIEYEGAESTANTVWPHKSTADDKYYYQLSSIATTGNRTGRCIELLQAGATLLTENASKGAAEGMLWSGPAAESGASNYDCQLWALEIDPNGSGQYALVCKASPQGSVNPNASAAGTTGRWQYDKTQKHYNFILGDNGTGSSNGHYYYTLRSSQYASLWVNCAMNFAVNLYSNPADGQGGFWEFIPTFSDNLLSQDELLSIARTLLAKAKTYESTDEHRIPGSFDKSKTELLAALVAQGNQASEGALQQAINDMKATMALPEAGQTYRIVNSTNEYRGEALVDIRTKSILQHSSSPWDNDAWVAKGIANVEGLHFNIHLQNKATNRYVGPPSSSTTDKLGNLVGTTSASMLLTYLPAEGDFTISRNDMLYYPIDHSSVSNPSTIAAATGAKRPQGTGWSLIPVVVLTYVCTTEEGEPLGTLSYSCPYDELSQPLMPTFEGYQLKEITVDTDNTTYRLTYTTGETAIQPIQAIPCRMGISDLQGRPLRHLPRQRGIYLVNGVKMVVRP